MSNYSQDVFEGFDISEDEVIRFGSTHVGFSRVDMLRVSEFMLIQLAAFSKHRTYNVFSITDVIQELEGIGRGCKVKTQKFKHTPLKGFWKTHFFDARFIPRNLINHWGLEFESSPKFYELCKRVREDEDNSPSKTGWQGPLAHAMTIEAYEERAKANRLTGEWIIYSKYEGKNYYLCISRHTSKESDYDVYSFLKTLCEHEYPFCIPNL